MTTALIVAAVWLALAILVALFVGQTVRLREERERPTGPRVRVEQARTVRPWVQR